MRTFVKEYATQGFRKREFAEYTFEPDTLTWTPEGDVPRETYLSLYSWDIDPRKLMETGEVGHPVVHYVIFDFDSSFELTEAQRDAANFVRHLEATFDVDPECLGVYFSGHKGFHVALPAEMFSQDGDFDGIWGLTPEMVKTFALRLATGFTTFDTSTFDRRRVFRTPGALNANSGLRKIQIECRELLYGDIDEIMEWAAEPKPVHVLSPPVYNKSLYELMLGIAAVARPEEREVQRPLSDMFAPARPGQRNTRATQVAGLLVKAMDDLVLTREIMRLWNARNDYPLSNLELDRVTTGVYQRYRDKHSITHKRNGVKTHDF